MYHKMDLNVSTKCKWTALQKNVSKYRYCIAVLLFAKPLFNENIISYSNINQ